MTKSSLSISLSPPAITHTHTQHLFEPDSRVKAHTGERHVAESTELLVQRVDASQKEVNGEVDAGAMERNATAAAPSFPASRCALRPCPCAFFSSWTCFSQTWTCCCFFSSSSASSRPLRLYHRRCCRCYRCRSLGRFSSFGGGAVSLLTHQRRLRTCPPLAVRRRQSVAPPSFALPRSCVGIRPQSTG